MSGALETTAALLISVGIGLASAEVVKYMFRRISRYNDRVELSATDEERVEDIGVLVGFIAWLVFFVLKPLLT